MSRYIIAVIVLIIIVLYFIMTWNVSTYEDYLYGYWAASNDDFCENSEIESMLLFIGDPDKCFWSVSRTCYLIIMNNLCNQGLTLSYKTGWAMGISKYKISANVEFDEENIWPDTVDIYIDMRDGTLEIKQDDIIYAKLTKQHDTTNAARILVDTELI